MDKSSYKRAMLIETSILTILCATFYLAFEARSKAMYAIWVWAIYFTFPGTYAIQPAVMNQSFGPRCENDIIFSMFSKIEASIKVIWID